jgi:hypothetical protein
VIHSARRADEHIPVDDVRPSAPARGGSLSGWDHAYADHLVRALAVRSLADHVGVLRDGRLVAQPSRDELQRTVRSYRLEVPDPWEAPRELQASGLRRSSAGRDVRCTLVGEEREVRRRLAAAGARVREVSTLALEDAALAFLPEDPS